MISAALAISGAVEAARKAAKISDLNIIFSFTTGNDIGLLTKYYGAVKSCSIRLTLKLREGAFFAKKLPGAVEESINRRALLFAEGAVFQHVYSIIKLRSLTGTNKH